VLDTLAEVLDMRVWITPEFEELSAGCEINGYFSAEL
jgi:coenzyme PQQ precursor peptide PqqA